METLNIHQLKGYLGTGLKILVYGQNVFENHICELNSLSNDNEAFFYGEWNNISNNEEYFKPILHPLSNLTKEITVNGETFVPIVELLKIKHKSWIDSRKENSRYSEIDFEINNNYAKSYFKYMASLSIDVWIVTLDNEPNWVIEKLYEWRFDIHGLIEKGNAVDVNSLDTNPYL